MLVLEEEIKNVSIFYKGLENCYFNKVKILKFK